MICEGVGRIFTKRFRLKENGIQLENRYVNLKKRQKTKLQRKSLLMMFNIVMTGN
jgi:hypothetical protein